MPRWSHVLFQHLPKWPHCTPVHGRIVPAFLPCPRRHPTESSPHCHWSIDIPSTRRTFPRHLYR
ncbi:hypothetical protein BC826DRAFT_1048888 [Russula brevipes]|nr:hypothetical protein BC826DRAFT_1048888 [Russula brevipes]